MTAADVFKAAMALVFETPEDVAEDDVYTKNFPEQLKFVMLHCLDMENGRREAQGLAPITPVQCRKRYKFSDTEELPFSDYTCGVIFPLYIASEDMRDNGDLSMSTYFYTKYVNEVNEHLALIPEEVGDIFAPY